MSRTHLRVLACLSDTQRTGALTVHAVAQRVRIERGTARQILRLHVRRGLAVQLPDRIPARWVITRNGLSVISESRYRDYIN
jgi:hypothetical protein